MNPETRREIGQFDRDQYRTLFWHVRWWMGVNHADEINKAVESAMKEIRGTI